MSGRGLYCTDAQNFSHAPSIRREEIDSRRCNLLSRRPGREGSVDIGQTRRATVMNIPVVGSLLRRCFLSRGAAAILVFVACCLAAPPHPHSRPNSTQGYST